MARPITRTAKLRDGYYIELRKKGENSGVKIRRDTYDEIQAAIRKYDAYHNVHFIGKVVKGKVVEE